MRLVLELNNAESKYLLQKLCIMSLEEAEAHEGPQTLNKLYTALLYHEEETQPIIPTYDRS